MLQISTETLYQKNQRYKEFKSKTEQELAEREQRVAFLEKRFNEKQQMSYAAADKQHVYAYNYEEHAEIIQKEDFNSPQDQIVNYCEKILHWINTLSTKESTKEKDEIENFIMQTLFKKKVKTNERISHSLDWEDVSQVQKREVKNKFNSKNIQTEVVKDKLEQINADTWTSNRVATKSVQHQPQVDDFWTQASLITQEDIDKVEQFESNYEVFLQNQQDFETYKKIQLKEIEQKKIELSKKEESFKSKEHQLQRQLTDHEIEKQKFKIQSEALQKKEKEFQQRESKLEKLNEKIGKL